MDRRPEGVCGKGAAASAVVASRDHEAGWFSAGIEDEVSSVLASGVVDGRRPVEAPVEVGLCPRDVEVNVDASLIPAGRENRAITSPICIRPIMNGLWPPAGNTRVRTRVQSQSGMVAAISGSDPIGVAAAVRIPRWATSDSAALEVEPAGSVLLETIEVRSWRRVRQRKRSHY